MTTKSSNATSINFLYLLCKHFSRENIQITAQSTNININSLQFIDQFFRIFPTFYKDLIKTSNSAHFTWRIYLSFFTSDISPSIFFRINNYPLTRYMLRFEHCKSSVSLIFNKVFLKEEIIERCDKKDEYRFGELDARCHLTDVSWHRAYPDAFGSLEVSWSNQPSTVHPEEWIKSPFLYNTIQRWSGAIPEVGLH
jgi:hypothetical protein